MIPRIFHRIWLDEPAPKRFEPFWSRLKELHPDWEFKTWDSSDELRSWIRNRTLFDRFIGPDPYGRIPDIARYEILYRYGGIYIDTDVEPLRSFEPLLAADTPFVGWEDDRCFCTAIMGAPPSHPAILDLIEAMPENVRKHEGTDPVQETGPTYAMHRWRHRPDVRRLAPLAFYPVHWQEMDQLWQPYPEGTFAVHHWAAGWKVKAHEGKVPGKLTKTHVQDISLLVPHRPDDGPRDRVWAWLEQYWQTFLPEAEIVMSVDQDGTLMSRAAALNDAVSRAHGSYLVVADSDVFAPVNQIRRCTRAIAEANEPVWFLPYTEQVRLSELATRQLVDAPLLPLSDFTLKPDLNFEVTDTSPTSIIHILPRRAWEIVDGFDERFKGWGGGEYEAFQHSLDTLYSPHRRLDATLWQLNAGRGAQANSNQKVLDDAQAATNSELLKRYAAARMNAKAMSKVMRPTHKTSMWQYIWRMRN